MKSFSQIDLDTQGDYLNLLAAVSKLSALFSDSATPLINYRVAENIFCKCFDAANLSRSDTAFDARINTLGIGLKTFVSHTNVSTEKVAEFNSESSKLRAFKGKELALEISKLRNERIETACSVYGIKNSVYHIVARRNKELLLFETDYGTINLDKIKVIKEDAKSLQFRDNLHYYSYNFSKSTLFRKFHIPTDAYRLSVDIIDDPYSLLLEIFNERSLPELEEPAIKGENYVILPLYSTRYTPKIVPENSGLNQWNASGRKRDIGEIYVPIPKKVHDLYPEFFPQKDVPFNLTVPTGETFSTKVCQENRKALMTNPNKALSDWLLRKVLRLKEGELATIEKLDRLGFDSVIITKKEEGEYTIDIRKTDSYEEFMNDE